MKRRLFRFFQELRAHGIQASPAETLDAARAISLLGIERHVLRAALATSLVKRKGDLPVFERLFELYFPAAPKELRKRRRHDSPRDSSGRGGPQPGNSLLGRSKAEDRALPSIHHLRGSDQCREAEESGPSNEGEAPQGQSPGLKQHSIRTVLDRPFPTIDVQDVRELQSELEWLARAFARRLRCRYAAAHRGRVDYRRTFRWSLAQGGIMCRIAWQKRRPRHADLVVLCDLSHSVATASHFFLTFVYALRPLFRRSEFYGFVDTPVEIDFTNGTVYPSGKLDLGARSDYGKLLRSLSGHPFRFSANTVLFILGDARNNWRPPERETFARIAGQCHAVVWINPEPQQRWNTGDSVIGAYAPFCTLLVEATTPRELIGALPAAFSSVGL